MGKFWGWGIALLVLLWIIIGSSKNSGDTPGVENHFLGQSTISRYDAISENWDEIKEYLSGTETINACSEESGNCYDLDADIENGLINEIYFPNGGYLYFGADIDSNGEASDFDQNGDAWDFTLDMDSSLVDDAVSDWASNNNYELE
jgi:hypothetical protein